jgi:hypothetical protein
MDMRNRRRGSDTYLRGAIVPATFDLNGSFHGLIGKPYGVRRDSTGKAVAFGSATSPFVLGYPFTDQVGFGTKYANPASLPVAVNAILFNSDATVAFLANNGSPFVTAYAWNSVTGWGAKFANPASLPNGACLCIDVHRTPALAHDHVAAGDSNGGTGIFLQAYKFSKSGAGWGTRYALPGAGNRPPAQVNGIAFSNNGAQIVTAHNTTPFTTAYPFTDASGFGTKFAAPSTLLGNSGDTPQFSKVGGAVIIAHGTSGGNLVGAYAFSAAGYGTKYANATYPGGWGTDAGQGLSVSALSAVVAQTLSASFADYIGWRWNDASGFGVRYPLLTKLSAANGVAFNNSGTSIFGAYANSPFMMGRRWTASGFGSLYTLPATPPSALQASVAVAPL